QHLSHVYVDMLLFCIRIRLIGLMFHNISPASESLAGRFSRTSVALWNHDVQKSSHQSGSSTFHRLRPRGREALGKNGNVERVRMCARNVAVGLFLTRPRLAGSRPQMVEPH